MSDVFISYARADRQLAISLADDLKARGYSVWWDTELLASDDFNDEIRTALSKASAVIVIWTKASVNSRFVRDEARFALDERKLISTKVADIDVRHLPFGFQGQHTEDLSRRDQIVRAIEKLGVHGASPAANSPYTPAAETKPHGRISSKIISKAPAGSVREFIVAAAFVAAPFVGLFASVEVGLLMEGLFALKADRRDDLIAFLLLVCFGFGWLAFRKLLRERNIATASLVTVGNGVLLFFVLVGATPSLMPADLGYSLALVLPVVALGWAFRAISRTMSTPDR